METDRLEPQTETLPQYSPDGNWWWDGETWVPVPAGSWLRKRYGTMPPSVRWTTHLLAMLTGAGIVLEGFAMFLFFPPEADSPDPRYLPFLLLSFAVLGSAVVVTLLLNIRRRLARAVGIVLPPVALTGMVGAALPIPLLRHLVVLMFWIIPVVVGSIGWSLFQRDAKAWFRVPPGRGW